MSIAPSNSLIPGNPLGRLAIGILAIIVVPILGFNLVEDVDAGEIMVVQSPFDGTLTWYTTPGVKPQFFGKATKYKKRHQFEFECPKDEGAVDRSLSTTFNDGGKGSICGSIAWEMPLATEPLTELHSNYGSDEAIQDQIIRTATEKAITMTGPLVSSTESYSARRNDLLSLVLDQIKHGVYRTNVKEAKVKDEMTGTDKTIKVVNLIPSTVPNDHGFERQEPSPLDEFKLTAFNLAIVDINYSADVVQQIKQQQTAIMRVQTAIAESKQAEQAAITAAKNGEAEAAKAKWEQEVIKAKEVTTAEQRKAVAQLDVQTAELRKRELILQGEGEAAKRRLIMTADGALEKKLEAWVSVQQAYAKAISEYKGQWVPSVVTDLLELIGVKTARDLAVDVTPGRQPSP